MQTRDDDMKTRAFIVRNDDIIAEVMTELKDGSEVRYAYDRCEERISANREYNLVNARFAKISRAKKYENQRLYENFDTAVQLNECDSEDFFILSDNA